MTVLGKTDVESSIIEEEKRLNRRTFIGVGAIAVLSAATVWNFWDDIRWHGKTSASGKVMEESVLGDRVVDLKLDKGDRGIPTSQAVQQFVTQQITQVKNTASGVGSASQISSNGPGIATNVQQALDLLNTSLKETVTSLEGKANQAHTHTITQVSGLQASLESKVDSSDARLTNARTPTSHSHPTSDIQQSGASAGQVLSWNGTAWVPASASGTGDMIRSVYDPDNDGKVNSTDQADNALSLGGQPAANYTTNTALTTALSGKENIITPGTTTQYWRGDKSWQTLDKTAVGLGTVDNTSDANKPVSTAVSTALLGKVNTTLTITGGTSLSGGGDLSANRTLTLLNDTASPGNSFYYGTNGTGTKGWFALSVGSGVSSVFGRTGAVTAQSGDYTTTQVTEGTSLYYTDSRFDTRLATKTTTDVAEGTNLYYTATRFNSAFSGKSTTDLAEGSNLYFTEARVRTTPLTGFSAAAGTVSATDTVLQAINKIAGNASTALSTTLPSANFFVGNASNVATGVAMSGDATLANTGAVTIANNAITTTKIADGNVTLAKLATDSVDASKIVDGSVGTDELANASVTAAKLATGAVDLSTSTVSGILPIANGGTGSATQNFVDLTTTQTIAGAKTFSSAPTVATFSTGGVLYAGTGGLLSQNNSNFYWDDTNARLGVGTTTPTERLEVASGTAGDSGVKLTDFTSGNTTAVAGVPIGVDASGKIIRVNSPTPTLAFRSVGFGSAGNTLTGTSDFVYDSSQKFLGISVDTPLSTLDLHSGNGITISGLSKVYTWVTPNPTTRTQIAFISYNVTAGSTYMGYGAANSVGNSGNANTVFGQQALSANTIGAHNTAIGRMALRENTTGGNTAVGSGALSQVSLGSENTAIGYIALTGANVGDYNIAIGSGSGGGFTGDNNIAIGANTSVLNNTIVNFNRVLLLGNNSQITAPNLSYSVAIGHEATVAASNTIALGRSGATKDRVGIGTAAPTVSLDINNTDAIKIPVGTAAQRPGTPAAGMLRFNTDTSKFEGYDGTAWVDLN